MCAFDTPVSAPAYINVQGAYFENQHGAYMAVSDPATIRGLQSGQITSVKRTSLNNVELVTPQPVQRATVSTITPARATTARSTSATVDDAPTYINVRGAYFKYEGGAYMAVSDATTLRGLQSGQIASTKRASLDNTELVTPQPAQRATTVATPARVSTPSNTSASTSATSSGTTSALSENDRRWLATLPQKYQTQVLSLTPTQIASKKNAGTWEAYQLGVQKSALANANARIDAQIVTDTVTGIPRETLKLAQAAYAGPIKQGAALAYEMSPAGSVSDILSGVQSGDLKKVGIGTLTLIPVGRAERVVTTTARFVTGVRLVDRSGKYLLEGTADLGPTLDRISAGKLLQYKNDGSIFRNDQGLLPKKSADYYREYVKPTPALNDGQGPERVIVGQNGETYYTPDHYKTFVPLN